ncbi:4-hydroxy-tetrahydrodipicolinate reductase [Buchnera aphidicola]|uniref:4-hydroxy-tetrahydrodipicolinate reductase n=1 Tax=Buchnera aphidicola subsp. Acyrthosiphon pisum (strain 5A) TaxID=563178 RepID=DAPB_BUCA5|nr:4-hydroxy-tetrahydrodipicolinate reductase [Buchnera aphidicola]B8D8U7.1 RecName: Full=4-hydroxy-tetrahydrodipicolinate reductase; Short=HTPA reductase [Buchnera aphidicola str. 5A (Acyrthosiphon pisum)]ACL30519.1 dihydrodipicolinate reductase [Buchnera aphidicola str. 5A (Acyrthosiphon pisum)]ADP66542.1 dihydrodipicolinate reductase [Buchnera aphidicola str. TLW03 (Acyrthosiphon pisum)]ADP67682.1 dihydrodipicolinate reductase [Buchnera aphidicola str. JF98 (Acyrthosiphon pisum)]
MNKKTRIAITGPIGRMGRMLIKEIQNNKHSHLTVAVVQKKHQLIGQDIGRIIGIGEIGVLISDELNIKKNDFDVLIDFTRPAGTLEYLKYCNKFKKNIVIGTTGFSKEEIDIIKSYSQKIAIIIASNFSIGINLLFQLIKKTTQIIGKDSDINILEYHHRNKIDAPSGTALEIGEVISKVMNWNLNQDSIYYQKGITGIRDAKKIGFSIVRAGNIVGKHTVMFSSCDEEIKITHTASNRMSFARGAIQSALWIHKKNTGLFDMTDVLSL